MWQLALYKITDLLWILLVILALFVVIFSAYLVLKWFSTAREAVLCLETDSVSFTDLSEKLLHRQIDSNLDEVIETLFEAISALDAAAKLQDSQVCAMPTSVEIYGGHKRSCVILFLSFVAIKSSRIFSLSWHNFFYNLKLLRNVVIMV